MKRKILSYLLIGSLTLFIGGYFTYVDAAGSNDYSTEAGALGGGSNGENGGGGQNGNSSAGSKANGMNPAGGDTGGGGGTTTTPPPSGTTPTNTQTQDSCPNGCCGIKLNTNFPFIGNCIKTKSGGTNPTNAFPTMLRALTKIIMSVILVICFILIIWSGILWSANKPKDAKKRIERVAITILLLGFSGVILKLINPNFFS